MGHRKITKSVGCMISWNKTITAQEAKQMSAIVLAFVGDAVFTLYVRKKLSLMGDFKTGELNKRASQEVSAHGQSILTDTFLTRLSEDELAIFHRGRNAKKPTKSKNASVAEYNRSTGFEAVIGYLYLSGQTSRIDELLESKDAD